MHSLPFTRQPIGLAPFLVGRGRLLNSQAESSKSRAIVANLAIRFFRGRQYCHGVKVVKNGLKKMGKPLIVGRCSVNHSTGASPSTAGSFLGKRPARGDIAGTKK